MIPILICHASWLPERKETLARLIAQIPEATVMSSRRREHATQWCHRAWQWAEDQDKPVCVLNDDVTVCPDFPRVLEAMVEAAPGRVLSLHTSAPGAEKIEGGWARCYWLTGPGYLLPRGVPTQLLEYWAKVPWSYASRFNEDNLAIQWAWDRQEPFWSSIPAVVRHDTATKSTLGYDNHTLRSSCVDWEAVMPASGDFKRARVLTSVDFWKDGVDAPPFLENPWATSAHLDATHRLLNGATPPCEMCWSGPGFVKRGSIVVCQVCLKEMIGMVFDAAARRPK